MPNTVSNRLFKRMLEFMSDGISNRGRIINVGASVGADTPVLIEHRGLSTLQPIGPFVDSFFSEVSEGLVDVEGFRTLGVVDGRVEMVSFSGVYRHRTETIHEVVYDGGRLRLTSDHSVFVFDEDRGILSVPTQSLRAGDYLITFRGDVSSTTTLPDWPVSNQRLAEVSAYQEVLDLHQQGICDAELGRRFDVSASTIRNWVTGRHKPRLIGRQWSARMHMPVAVPITPDLAELWGYYLAEGHARKAELSFCLGAHEVEFQSRVKDLMQSVFGMAVTREHSPVPGERILVYGSVDLTQAFRRTLGGSTKEKHVPDELWLAPLGTRRAFLAGYLRGDGSTDKRRNRSELTTVSPRIAQDILWLLRCTDSSGRPSSLRVRERAVNGRRLKETIANRISIPVQHRIDGEPTTADGHSAPDCDSIPSALLRTLHRHCRPIVPAGDTNMESLPVGPTVGKVRALRVADDIWRRRRRDSDFYGHLRMLLTSPLGAAAIRTVSKATDTDEYVYDLVGCRGEAFFGGQQPVLLHNSNRPDLLDAALKRPGRYDDKIPFLVPSADDRWDIVEVMARAYGLIATDASIPVTDADKAKVITALNGWTGAEIEAAVVKAGKLVRRQGMEIVPAIMRATKTLTRSTSDVEFMTALAIQECNDTDLLPPHYQEQAKNRTALAARVSELAPQARNARSM